MNIVQELRVIAVRQSSLVICLPVSLPSCRCNSPTCTHRRRQALTLELRGPYLHRNNYCRVGQDASAPQPPSSSSSYSPPIPIDEQRNASSRTVEEPSGSWLTPPFSRCVNSGTRLTRLTSIKRYLYIVREFIVDRYNLNCNKIVKFVIPIYI